MVPHANVEGIFPHKTAVVGIATERSVRVVSSHDGPSHVSVGYHGTDNGAIPDRTIVGSHNTAENLTICEFSGSCNTDIVAYVTIVYESVVQSNEPSHIISSRYACVCENEVLYNGVIA